MEIVLRAAVTFIVLWLITRAVGRSTLGELSSFELLLFITMGDLVQQGITQEDHSVTGSLLAVGTIALRAERMGIDDLMTAARGQGFRNFSDIDLAVLEPNGKISFFAKDGSGADGSPEQPEVG
jgi:uncharacterized membrane protein YcaP (DUF421 family)